MRLIKTYKGYFIRKKSGSAYFVFSSICAQHFDPIKTLPEAEKFIDNLIAKKECLD